MRKTVMACALALVCPLAVYAGEPGSEALPFIRMTTDAAKLGMAGTGYGTEAVAFSLDASRTLDAHVGFVSWMPDLNKTDYVDLGAVFRTGNLAFSLAGFRGTGEKISHLDFTPYNIFVKGGAAYRIGDILSAGASVAYAREEIAKDHSYGAVAADVFVAAGFAGWNFAAGVSSLGSAISSGSGGDFSLPASASFDGGYSASFGSHALKADAAIDYYFSGALSAALGAEYCYAGMVSLRAGYRAGGDSVIPSYGSAGLGLSYAGIHVDFAWLFASDVLGGGFGLSLGYRF